MKKVIVSLLAIAMAAGVFAGCGSSAPASSAVQSDSGSSAASSTESSVSAPAEDASGVSAPGEYPIVSDKFEMRIFMASQPNITSYEDNGLTYWMEEQTNVHITWDLVASNDRDQKLNLMLASGENLADVIMGGIASPMLVDYATQGYFVSLTEIIEAQAVNLNKAYDMYPGTKEIMTAPDGNLYSMPAITDVLGNKYAGRMWVNRPWLDALGLDVPTTTDEFADMLRAFRDGDPNGNGLKDEIPMMGSTDGWAGVFDRFLLNSFILYNDSNPYMVQDGKVVSVYDTDEYREGMSYLSMLVSEGLYDTASFTQTNDQLKQILETEAHAMIGAIPSGGPTTFGTTGSARKIDYEAIAPLKGPNGVQLANYDPYAYLSSGGHMFVVTKECDDPVVAVKWADLLYTEEGSRRARWGVPGENHIEADPGSLNGLGEPAKWQSLLPWGSDTNAHWAGRQPQLENFSGTGQAMPDPTGTNYPISNDRITTEKYIMYAAPLDNYLQPMMYTDTDSTRLNEIESVLKPYIKEARALFATGRMSVENDWDEYLKQLDAMDYKEAIEIMQRRYDELN